MKIRDLIEGKVAVIDFWLSQVGKILSHRWMPDHHLVEVVVKVTLIS